MRSIWSIIFKDVIVELRNKETLSAMIMFAVLILVVFNFAFESSGVDKALIAPGSLWVAFSFAAILGLNRSLAKELDNECLQGLLLAPISRGDLYLAKVAGNFIFMIVAEAFLIPMFVILNNMKFDLPLLKVAGIGFLGMLAIASVGTILSVLSSATRMKEVMLPILQIPLTIPVVICAAEATAGVLIPEYGEISSWLSILAGFTIVYLTVSYLIFDFAVED
jgi:heme exporter protein B